MSSVDDSGLSNVVSLEKYRVRHDHRARRSRWVDDLPDDIVAEIMASTAGSTITTRWLREVHGYQDATVNRVAALIRDRMDAGERPR